MKNFRFIVILLVLVLVTLACGSAGVATEPVGEPPSPTLSRSTKAATEVAEEITSIIDEILPTIQPLCEASFSGSVSGGSAQPPLLALINLENEERWTYDESISFPKYEAQSVSELQSLVCIKESIRESSIQYTDFTSGYSRIWDVRLVQYPDGEVIKQAQFTGYPPVRKTPENKGIGSRPLQDLSNWLQGLDNNTTLYFSGPVGGVAFTPDGMLAVGAAYKSSNGQTTLSIWDTGTGQEVRSFENYHEDLPRLAFSPDGMTLMSVGNNADSNKIVTLDMTTGEIVKSVDVIYSNGHVAFSPNGEILAISEFFDGEIHLWDMNTGQFLRTLRTYSSEVHDLAFSPDGNTLASGSDGGDVSLWDMTTGEFVGTFPVSDLGGNSVAFSPDGKILASDDVTEEAIVVRLWDLASKEEILTIPLPDIADPVYHVEFSPNGELLAVVFLVPNNTVHVLQTSDGTHLFTFSGHSDLIESVAFSPDSKTLVTGGSDGIVNIWNLREMTPKTFLLDHSTFTPRSRSAR